MSEITTYKCYLAGFSGLKLRDGADFADLNEEEAFAYALGAGHARSDMPDQIGRKDTVLRSINEALGISGGDEG